jgi:hypothetical protein
MIWNVITIKRVVSPHKELKSYDVEREVEGKIIKERVAMSKHLPFYVFFKPGEGKIFKSKNANKYEIIEAGGARGVIL